MNTAVMFSSARGDHATPQWLFDELNREFHFDVDGAADGDSSLCGLYLSDALHDDWSGGRKRPSRVFLNPPYGRDIGRWTTKAIVEVDAGHAEIVVLLLPARTDTSWFRKLVEYAAEVRFIPGRLKFGDAQNSAPFPSCVVVVRPRAPGFMAPANMVMYPYHEPS